MQGYFILLLTIILMLLKCYFQIFILFMCVCLSVCVSAGNMRGQKRALDYLKLELQVVVNWLTWMLGFELASPERATSALIHLAISPAPTVLFYKKRIEEVSLYSDSASCSFFWLASSLSQLSFQYIWADFTGSSYSNVLLQIRFFLKACLHWAQICSSLNSLDSHQAGWHRPL